MKVRLKYNYELTKNTGIFTYVDVVFSGEKKLSQDAIDWMNKKFIDHQVEYNKVDDELTVSMIWR